MREFVYDKISPIRRIGRAAPGVVPCQNERSEAASGMTKPMLVAFLPNVGAKVPLLVRRVARGVDQNRR
jgi:hypothetical protein